MIFFLWFSNTVAAMGKAIKVFMTHLSYDILWTTSVQFFMTCQRRSSLTKKNVQLFSFPIKLTVFENHRKSLIQHCERSELRLHFEWPKSSLKMLKMVNWLKLKMRQFCWFSNTVPIFKSCRVNSKIGTTFWIVLKKLKNQKEDLGKDTFYGK